MNDIPRVLRLQYAIRQKNRTTVAIDPITFDRNDVRRIFRARQLAIQSRSNGE